MYRVLLWVFLLYCNGSKCCQHSRIDCSRIIQKISRDFLYKIFTGYDEGFRYVCSLCILVLCSIVCPNVLVRLVLRILGFVVSESCEGICYIRQHLQLYLVLAVVPIEIQPQVPFSLPIVVDFYCSLKTDMRCPRGVC